MFIHRIFRRRRIKIPSCRGRRARSTLSLALESLENRTPLSSGLGAAIEAAVVSRAAEIGFSIPRLPLVVEWTSLGASITVQAASTVPSQIVPFNATLSVSVSTTPASPPALEQFTSDSPEGAVLSSVNATTGPDGALGSGPIRALIQAAASGGSVEVPPNDQPGVVRTARELLPDITYAIDHVEDEGDTLPFPFPPGSFAPMGPATGRGSSQTSDDADHETDMSNVGTLELFEWEDGFSPGTTTSPAPGHATLHALSFVVTDPSLEVEETGEVPNTTGLSYLATGGRAAPYSPASAGDGVLAWDEGSTEPISPTSITVGGASLNVLLNAVDGLIQTEPGDLEQVAELVPLPESSLALAATLWTVPSDSPTATNRREAPAGKAIDLDAQNAMASSWVLFVTGMDRALEQASRDIRDRNYSRDARQAASERPASAPEELIDWQGPILPAAHGGLPAPKTKSPRSSPAATFGEAGQGSVRNQQDARPHSGDVQPVVLGVMPMVSAVSISTLIAGWFWRKRGQMRKDKDTSRRTLPRS